MHKGLCISRKPKTTRGGGGGGGSSTNLKFIKPGFSVDGWGNGHIKLRKRGSEGNKGRSAKKNGWDPTI